MKNFEQEGWVLKITPKVAEIFIENLVADLTSGNKKRTCFGYKEFEKIQRQLTPKQQKLVNQKVGNYLQTKSHMSDTVKKETELLYKIMEILDVWY